MENGSLTERIARSQSKMELQQRIMEIGQGQIHGKRGLPGMRKGSQRVLLVPANMRKSSQGRTSSRLRAKVQEAGEYQMFSGIEDVQQLAGEHEVVIQISPQRKVPKILNLNQINQHEVANNFTPSAFPKEAKSHRNLPTLKTDRSQLLSFLNVDIERKHSNPQFQALNLAPYQKESREFIHQRQLSSQGFVPLTQRAATELGGISTAHSKPIVSQLTGMSTMTPLGPALSSMRSLSKTKIEQQTQFRKLQRELSRHARQNILDKKEEENIDLLDSRLPQQKVQKSFRNTQIQQMLTSEEDSRFKKMKLKLSEQQPLIPNSSRSNIIPGNLEAKEEAIRSHLLIGKLKQTDKLPKAYFGGDQLSLASSRAIPQILSDQTSNFSRQISQKSGMISHVQQKLTNGRQAVDYKPRDYGILDDATTMEPEPEFIQEINYNSQLSEEQQLLEKLIYSIQNEKNYQNGYFVYLKQNEKNRKNPYDLVPFKFEEENAKDENRADQNLNYMENFEKKRKENERVLIKERKAFKSQYHQQKQIPLIRQSYEYVNIKDIQKQRNEYNEQNLEPKNKFFTLSKKGFTTYIDDQPVEFLKIEYWLEERERFMQISTKKFFSKFRTWKVLRMWRNNIVAKTRQTASKNLKMKLFHVNSIFGKILLQHREACKELETLRLMDLNQFNRESFNIVEFQLWQKFIQDNVAAKIKKASDNTSQIFQNGIKQILDQLRHQIIHQEEQDEKDDITGSLENMHNQAKANYVNNKQQNENQLMRQIEKLDNNKGGQNQQSPVFSQIGFKHNLRFGAKSQLRDACKRFLRFAFLLDFIAMESLTNIYILTIDDTIKKLKQQLSTTIDYTLYEPGIKPPRKDADDHQFNVQIPLFQAECIFKEVTIPARYYQHTYIDKYEPPPIGKSTLKDFSPQAHLQLEADDHSSEEPVDDILNNSIDSKANKLYVKKVQDIQSVWLNLMPDANDLSSLIKNTFQNGFDALMNFERWGMHQDLQVYDQVLEPWDYRSYERWEPPEDENGKYLNCDDWLQENPLYHNIQDIDILIEQAVEKVERQFEEFEPILHEYWENQQLNFKILEDEKLMNPVEMLPVLLQKTYNQKTQFDEMIPEYRDLGMMRVKFKSIKNAIKGQPKEYLQKFKQILPNMVKKRIFDCKLWLSLQIDSLKIMPANVDQFVTQIQCLDYIEENYQSIKDKVELNSLIFNILERYALPTREDRQSRFIDDIYQMMSILNNAIYDTKDQAVKRKDLMKMKIQKKVPKLNERVSNLDLLILQQKFLDLDPKAEDLHIQGILSELKVLDNQFQEISWKKKKIQIYQKTMDMGHIDPFNNVEDTKVILSHRLKLWKSISSWRENTAQWETQKFVDVNVNNILEQASQITKIVLQCERNLPENSQAVQYLKKMVFDFKEAMPIVESLDNENLQPVHWVKIKQVMKIEDFPLEEKQFTLGELVKFNVANLADEIVNISVTATQEKNLQNLLDKLKERWAKLDFEIVKHKDKDALKIINFEKIQIEVDESMVISSSIVGSRYVQRLQGAAQDQQDRLLLIYDTIEQWREFQKNWLYLENIFSSQDIRKQRHKDFLEYEGVNKNWFKLMKATKVKPNVKFQCTTNKQRYYDFLRWNQTMDNIQKNLEGYLEEKRELFSRFYFISNDELLQILAHQTDLKAIEKQVKKCFENLNSFVLIDDISNEKREIREDLRYIEYLKLQKKAKAEGQNFDQKFNPAVDIPIEEEEKFDKSDFQDIYGIKSLEGERLKFNRVLKVRAQGVEEWMKTLEDYMVLTMQRKIKEANNKYYEEGNDRNIWVLSHISQAVAVIDQVTWTDGTEMALSDLMDEDYPFAMEDHFQVMKQQLDEFTELIRGQLTANQRKTLVALITQDVHSRDIVEQLWKSNVQSPFEFLWQQQLRYYIEDEIAIIRQVNCQILYAYEFMGPTSRLIITPLTDKCWMTITGAMHIKLGASPAGPAGTGKTESTKDLAKALGIYCVVINCSDQIEYRTMGKLFSGLVQSGSWTCLDEFNRINIEVLSVIAQQLLDIKLAKVIGKEKFMFNQKLRELKHQCGVFITMNPGYAGRTELPDNLKVLFRPVSMMIPNYGLIAEIMLYAEGFSEAQALSTKMVQLYKLASEQLSQQDHYDFGLRAVKSVLVMAGNLKRQHPNLPENIVLIRAMRDSNVPKFLASDLPLFSALIQDLFPGVQIPESSHVQLSEQINKSLKFMKLQIVEKQNQKVIQFFETLNVRFGVMIVGPTGGGKSTIYQLLAHSMTELKKNGTSDERFQEVKLKVLNPKAITMGELYGEENIDSQEWTDGLASKILRKSAQLTSDRKNWCIFDGPVDALWIENMNTVLDDNMTLCLVNGERIKLNHNIRILFEVQDLAQASPATVSRCGMVYVSPSDLGWRPFFYSWIEQYISNYLKGEKLDYIINMFEMFVDLAFSKLEQHRVNEVMHTTKSQNIQCMCNIIERFIKDNKIQQEDRVIIWQKQLNMIFAFSMIWGFGASFNTYAQRFLDSIFRDFFGKCHLPPKETVFFYYYNPKEMMFKPWNDLVPEFEKRIVAPYDNLFVPTIDSVSSTKILTMLMDQQRKVFFTGGTGVGKSIIIQEYINSNIDSKSYAPIILNFSAQTSSNAVQKSIETKLEKKRGKKVIGAKGNQKSIIFIDDINMPLVEQYGAQPPIEFLRLLIDKDIIYDRPNFFKKKIEDFLVVCAAAPPGGGRAALTPRFMRHFHIINIPNASEEIMTVIFETIIETFLSQNLFSDPVKKCGNIAVAATIDMFTQFNKNMLPIPSKFHYLFNLRDVSKVFQGILMVRPQSVENSKVFTKLWLHECQRVFHDRLIDQQDRDYFKSLAMELINLKFKEKWKEEDLFTTTESTQKVTFSIILKCDYEERLYEQVMSPSKLIKALEDKMIDYNYTFTQSQMSLIFFEDAIDHVCRISRILNQPRGNAMLIGVSGCGKQSLTRLAAFLHDASCSQIKLSKNYKPAKFREDVKEMLLESGCKRKAKVFLMADTQILHEQFLEDINCILNTGEIVDLYEKEDFDNMEFSLSKLMKEKRIPLSRDNIYKTFIQEIRLNFHIIMAMSPVGDSLRIRCRNFPSLVNCCTLDWFDNWPEQALQTVSEQFFQQNALIQNDDKLRNAILQMFPKIHSSVQDLSLRFYEEKKRRVYITPKTFLDALKLFKDTLDVKSDELQHGLNRLKNGIDKLELTNKQIQDLQITLKDLVPKLREQNENATLQVKKVQEQTELASQREQEVEIEQRQVSHEAKMIQRLKENADKKVLNAQPALVNAEKAVNELSKADIDELKKVNNPIAAVKLVMDCTLIFLGIPKNDWIIAQKTLADMKFLDRLRCYDRDNIPDKMLDKVKNLTNKPEFDINIMTRASKAAGGLAKWCKSIREYAEQLKVVKPLLAQQADMREKLDIAQQIVHVKGEEVKHIKQKLSMLQEEYQSTLNQIQELSDYKILCEQRLTNADKLLSLLTDEGKRWRDEIQVIYGQLQRVTGDVFVSSSQMSYLGPFTGEYRELLIYSWIKKSLQKNIELSPTYSLVQTLGNPIEIRKWGVNGLPSDSVSIDNAIFTMKCQRWPILIDPQFQGNSWLKKMYKSSDLNVLKIQKGESETNFNPHSKKQTQSQIIENAIRNGEVLLLEDMSEEIDPSIEQIVSKAVYREDGIYKINIGDKPVDYHENFKMFLTTKLPNPHFLPEVSIKLTVINFTVTFDGLDEQLLAEAVKNLDPEVEELRNQLIIEISAVKNEQFETQSSILNSLAESNQDTILDNEALIQTLKISKEKSIEIEESLLKSEQIEKTVQIKREQYRDLSIRGSILYFVIASLSSIDPMYQNSLVYVKKIYNDTIKKIIRRKLNLPENTIESSSSFSGEEVEPSEQPSMISEVKLHEVCNIDDLMKELIKKVTENLFISICRGLFESHKIIYSFMICTSIMKNEGLIQESDTNLLLRGQGLFDKSEMPQYNLQVHDFISQNQWDLAYCMQQKIPVHFENLLEILLEKEVKWRIYAKSSIDGNLFEQLPPLQKEGAKDKYILPLFFKLMLIKLLKPQVFTQALIQFVELTMGPLYSKSPLTSMEELFESSDNQTPIIFILSQGADPNERILNYAKQMKFQDKIFQKSLGQGQERAATYLIRNGMANGDWILLQNCHLFKSWMPQLEQIVSDLKENTTIHKDFRLILTSMPCDYFPSSILQNGVKMTTEPPQGLKANMLRIFSGIIDKGLYDSALENIREIAEAQRSLDQNNATSRSFAQFSEGSKKSQSVIVNKIQVVRPSLMPGFERKFDLAKTWKSLLFGLSFFHSIVQERKKYGSIGWNIRYEFNDSDLETSIKMLQNFLFESEEIPWESMQFMTGHINYGGRVTDDNDRILLMSMLKKCYGKRIIGDEDEPRVSKRTSLLLKKRISSIQKEFSFFESRKYKIPSTIDQIEDVLDYIKTFPDIDDPMIFGMHSNANISFQQQEGNNMIKTILNIQMQPVVSKKLARDFDLTNSESSILVSSSDDQVIDMARELYKNRPLGISNEDSAKGIFKKNAKGLLHCYSIVLLQEIDRYNKLIKVIDESLELLIKAVQGLVIMSPQLDQMYGSFLKNQVPKNWEAVSYNSLKSLSSWFKDLHLRVEFMRTWMQKGHPNAYWLSGFFFPHGFMTGILQTFARKHQKAIDFLKFKFDILDLIGHGEQDLNCFTEIENIKTPPADGVFIYGIFIEQAVWNQQTNTLNEQPPGIMITKMPVIHFLPYEFQHKQDQHSFQPVLDRASLKKQRVSQIVQPPPIFEGEPDPYEGSPNFYPCPVYKTSQRAGVLSTTGQSTNYILSVSIPIEAKKYDSEHWTLRGVALITMLDD